MLGTVVLMASRPLDPEHLEAQVVPRDTEREPIPDPQITEREVERKVKRKEVKVKARKVIRTKEKAKAVARLGREERPSGLTSTPSTRTTRSTS